jgi:hypothetical protein
MKKTTVLDSLVRRYISYPLRSKEIVWTKKVKIYTDGGMPIMCYWPRFTKLGINDYWGLSGFHLYWLGREFTFVYGEDINGLYCRQNQ